MQSKPTDLEAIQKLRVKVAYLWGLGVGVTLTALQLAPAESKSGDSAMVTTVFGLVVIAAAIAMTLYVRRREVRASRQDNLAQLADAAQKTKGRE